MANIRQPFKSNLFELIRSCTEWAFNLFEFDYPVEKINNILLWNNRSNDHIYTMYIQPHLQTKLDQQVDSLRKQSNKFNLRVKNLRCDLSR